MCFGILFEEPNPHTGSRPRDLIGLCRQRREGKGRQTLNPYPRRNKRPPRALTRPMAGGRSDLPKAHDGGGGVVSRTHPTGGVGRAGGRGRERGSPESKTASSTGDTAIVYGDMVGTREGMSVWHERGPTNSRIPIRNTICFTYK